MICDYCRTTNSETDHRCRRCQRRLGSFAAMSSASYFPASRQATAVAYEPVYESAPAQPQAAKAPVFESIKGDRPAGQTSTPAHQEAMQSVLFAIRNATKIVSIDGRTEVEVEAPAAKPPPAPKANKAKTPAVKFEQQILDLCEHTRNDFRKVPTEARDHIYCQDRVASVYHRVAGTVVDVTFMLLSLALFASVFVYGGGEISLESTTNKIVFGSLALLIPLLYKLFWAVAGADSPGASIVGLRLTDFDGRRPGRSVRIHRMIWSGVSTFSAYLGIAWVLFDEESLSWHDHVTRTFLTADGRPSEQPGSRNPRLVDAWVN